MHASCLQLSGIAGGVCLTAVHSGIAGGVCLTAVHSGIAGGVCLTAVHSGIAGGVCLTALHSGIHGLAYFAREVCNNKNNSNSDNRHRLQTFGVKFRESDLY